jgi:hypothetical protein
MGRCPDHGPDWLIGLGSRRRIVARRRRAADAVSRFLDYGPDWPPRPPRSRHTLLRRCVAAVVLYAVIWALGAVLLEFRLLQLRHLTGGMPVTTYTDRHRTAPPLSRP